MKIDFNPEFTKALELLNDSNEHLFITGKAGTGKSTLLDYFAKFAKHKPVLLAPTGVAALNVSGQTIHRFFNFSVDVTVQSICNKENKPRNLKLYKKIHTIIIDEVSMLRADLLDYIQEFLFLYGPKVAEPFGGVQMVFVGDLYQLPPVVSKNEREIFSSHYETPYFFSAKALQTTELTMIELDKVYRQKDSKFVDLLNKIRNNSVTNGDLDVLNERYQKKPDTANETGVAISLTTTNKKSDQINEGHLDALDVDIYRSEATIKGDFGKEYYPTAKTLQYKVGAQVMLLNNDQKQNWVNGSIGIIEAIKYDQDDEESLHIKLQNSGKTVSVQPYTWEVFKFTLKEGALMSEPAGSFTQYPLRLAWAVTIHKSQGKTFDKVTVDIGNGTFASGQTYVALSRCKSLQGISLSTPIKKHHIRTDPRISKYLTDYAYQKAIQQTSIEERMKLIGEAILKKAKLKVTYLKANDCKSKHDIVPVCAGVQEYQGKKFRALQGYCSTNKEIQTFNVARILSVTISPQ